MDKENILQDMKNNIKGVILIGANLGQEYEGWIAGGREDFIFFEPVKFTFNRLSKIMFGKPRIKLFNIALGNYEGNAVMYIETVHEGKSCSILKPLLHLEQYPDIEFTGEEIVSVNKLDNINYDRTLYDHLHIDTQGYELEVLKGAKESLKFIKTIQIEVYRKELYKGCPMFEEIMNYLKDFDLTEIFWRGNTWGDAKFRRHESID
jgi:FkbM family methyltransferase